MAIQKFGRGCLLVKRDFESAFRHIPISLFDSGLLGFHWENKYYSERFLPFYLRTAPFQFNIFAETFHWILATSAKSILPHVLHIYLPVWSSNTTSPYPSYPSCIHIMF